MTWVLGWPFYDDDAIELAKKHNLVKDPNATPIQYVNAARSWVSDRVGVLQGFCCWVGTELELVLAAYVEYDDKPTPPTREELDRDYLMSAKYYRRLRSLMPLRDFAWYQHDDPSCTLYSETIWVYDDDEEEESSNEEDEGCDEISHREGEDVCDEEVVDDNGASDWEDEESDTETVTARNARNRSLR